MEPILETNDLSKRFPLRRWTLGQPTRWIEAVKEVNLALTPGESVGLVGESGCGKSTLARMLCGLLPPSRGVVRFHGRPFFELDRHALFEFRRTVQPIFQDPMASLNPLQRIGQAVGEPILIHGIARGQTLKGHVQDLLREVGLNPDWIDRFPSNLSGGERQRVGIARAMSLNPAVLICDEPVSSLDLSVQAQILALFTALQSKRGLALLFISHNLATVSVLCDRILVMRQGRIIEEGKNPDLFHSPREPYTRTLVNLALQTIQW